MHERARDTSFDAHFVADIIVQKQHRSGCLGFSGVGEA